MLRKNKDILKKCTPTTSPKGITRYPSAKKVSPFNIHYSPSKNYVYIHPFLYDKWLQSLNFNTKDLGQGENSENISVVKDLRGGTSIIDEVEKKTTRVIEACRTKPITLDATQFHYSFRCFQKNYGKIGTFQDLNKIP